MQSQSKCPSPAPEHPPADQTLPSLLQQRLDALARQHGFTTASTHALWRALALGRGTMAQFSHPEFGGSGQWMRGGMLMIGDMFNHALKARVAALCTELAALHDTHPEWQNDVQSARAPAGEWWPAGLHSPSSSGAQNGMAYAYFPTERRLAIQRQGVVEVYDTGDHLIASASQQQGGSGTLTFLSQLGPVDAGALRRIPDGAAAPAYPATSPAPSPSLFADQVKVPASPGSADAARTARQGDPRTDDQTLALLEKLAALHANGVLTEAEFAAKKTELLTRF